MIVVYITNKLFPSVLNNETPYDVLHSSKPKYSKFRIFGCLMVARNPTREHDKFPQREKGYKLLKLVNNTIFVSKDVKFYEHIYPYQVFNSKATKQASL